MRNHAADVKVFKAFCDENRLQVLELLRGGELLKVLTDLGASAEQDGCFFRIRYLG